LSQPRKFGLGMFLTVSLLVIASVALSAYIVNQPQQSVTTYLPIVNIVPAAGPSCTSAFSGGGVTGVISACGTNVTNTITFPPSDLPAVALARILVIIFVGAAIALVIAYGVIQHTKPPQRDKQTSLKQFTQAEIAKPIAGKSAQKFCANCGNSLAAGVNFRNECGSKQV